MLSARCVEDLTVRLDAFAMEPTFKRKLHDLSENGKEEGPGTQNDW